MVGEPYLEKVSVCREQHETYVRISEGRTSSAKFEILTDIVLTRAAARHLDE